MSDGRFIDVHCGWGSVAAAPNWKDIPEIQRVMAKRGIGTVCISSLLARKYDTVEGNRAVSDAVKAETPIGGVNVLGWIALHPGRANDLSEQMKRSLYHPRLVGAALYPDPLTNQPLSVADVRELLNAFRRFTKPLLIETRDARAMAQCIRIAEEFANLKMIASGMGGEEWRESLSMVTRHPNLNIDISGALIPEKINYAIDIMHGSRKILFASGAPHTDPAAVLGMLNEAGLSTDDSTRILYRNAEKLLHLDGGALEITASQQAFGPDEPATPNYLIGNVTPPAPVPETTDGKRKDSWGPSAL